MKKINTFLIISMLPILVYAQGIEFFHGTWDEALKAAYEEEKIIFVDAYTTWCGPCKTMAKYTFTDEEVGTFFNENFINVKLDMEKEAGMNWRKKYPVTAFPTLYFVGPEGEVVLKSVGAKKPKDLLSMGSKAAKGSDTSKKYADQYDAGDRSYEVMYHYVRTLNKAKKPSLKYANEYLNTQSDLTTEDNLKFILEATVQVDSKIFELLEKHKKAIEKVTSKEEVNKRIMYAAQNTVTRAAEYEAESLLEEAQQSVKTHLPDQADRFNSKSSMKYALALRDGAMYEKHAKAYLKKEVKDDAKELHAVARQIHNYFANQQSLMSIAEKAARNAYELDQTTKFAVTYVKVLHENGKTDEAIGIIDTELKKTSDDKNATKQLNILRKRISNI